MRKKIRTSKLVNKQLVKVLEYSKNWLIEKLKRQFRSVR